VRAPAIATSAELDAGSVVALRAAGFTDTLAKPATVDDIENLLRKYFALPAGAGPSLPADESPALLPILDDGSALAAIGGDRAAMRALRGLFAQELEALERDLQAAPTTDSQVLSGRLHRLRASSGFCGAAALAAAALRLQGALARDSAHDAMAEFARICNATRTALAEQR
jgi:HPt (histidine-containing phosphotransfer) domain-containing protein